MSLPIIIRPSQESDRPFVVSSWVQTFKRGYVHSWLKNWKLGLYAKCLEPDRANPSTYMFLQTKLVNHLLDTASTVVACYADDPSLVLGFACGDVNTRLFHYAVVKMEYQRQGIGTALCDALRASSPGKWDADRLAYDLAAKCRKMWDGGLP